MYLYLDTSTLVKLYVDEPDSVDIVDLVKASQVTATSSIAYAEARAAFARRFREKSFNKSAYRLIVSSLDEDWQSYLQLKLNDTWGVLRAIWRKSTHFVGLTPFTWRLH